MPIFFRTLLRWFTPLIFALTLVSGASAAPTVLPPENALTAAQLGIIVNDDDPLSIAIGNYYKQRRKIPDDNIVHIRFKPGKSIMQPGEFAVLKSSVDARLPARVQALALTWTAPYRVGCMSITAAFTFGYDVRYCAEGCQITATSSYANSNTHKPFDELGIRPTMMLAATSKPFAFALIERGIEADYSLPNGAAYLIETSDVARSVRKELFPAVLQQFGARLPVHIEQAPTLENAKDVMFYVTGSVQVAALDSNHYLPGAIGDHLTSYGGQLTGHEQMSALRWLEAGVTGSYGTVVEPCAFIAKFPNPQILLKHYLAGETLLEAYWKSVVMPGQGVFIGEPLARPYGAYRIKREGAHWYVGGPALQLDTVYNVFAADNVDGPFERVASGVKPMSLAQYLELPEPIRAYYRLEPLIGIDGFIP